MAHNSRILGVAIDQDTAAIMERGRISVIGPGAVYVVDGADVSPSNIAEGSEQQALSMHEVKLHVLSAGDSFDLRRQRPEAAKPE